MRLTKVILSSRQFRPLYRPKGFLGNQAQTIKVNDDDNDNSLKLTFKYSNSPYLNLKVSKEETLQLVLHRIKLMVGLQKKKEEIRQLVVRKYSQNAQVVEESVEEDFQVSLIEHDEQLNESLSNAEAWTRASMLKIGDSLLEVKYNVPTVVALSLPNFIVSNCPVRAHYILECASSNQSTFVWYRSISRGEAEKIISNGKGNDIIIEESKCWLKVCDDFIYHTTNEDIGCYLKVVCTPKSDKLIGLGESAESNSVVEACLERYPFEDRQLHTACICDSNSLRCVSYNVLANCYVEKRKYPHCSVKARDKYYRRQILLKELLGYHSDIICLQEVPERNFYSDLLPILSEVGLNGFYLKKGGRRNEGLATFFRTSKYKVIKKFQVLLNDVIKDKEFYVDVLSKVSGNLKDMSKLLIQDTAFLVLLMEQVANPDRKIVIANTHLYSNKDMPEVRLMQAAICTYFIEHEVNKKNKESVPLLFCGDFNSLPDSATYDFITSGNYTCPQNLKSDGKEDALSHGLNLESACGTPEYTNYTNDFQGCLDYIFYSKDLLKVTEVVPMPNHEDIITTVGLPNEAFPSDHIALICTLQWKNC